MAEEYEILADTFLFGPIGPDTEECFRIQGGFARFNKVTEEYVSAPVRKSVGSGGLMGSSPMGGEAVPLYRRFYRR